MKTLTAEQQAIVARWEAEREARSKLIDKLAVAEKNGDDAAFKSILDEIMDLTPSHCEHGRDVISTCMACDEIERIIHPELFKDEEDE